MTSSHSSDLKNSLAFVDVLCCAFAGVLLTFLIVLTTWKHSTARSANRPVLAAEPPFLILVTRIGDDGPSETSSPMRFHIRSNPDWIAAVKRDRVESVDYAFLVGKRPPPDSIITLSREIAQDKREELRLQITVLADGQRTERKLVTRFDQPVLLWPQTKDESRDSQ